MTDKQIIIDGVDVSKCEYLQYKGCNFPQCLVKIASFDLKCEGYNCHLKRLAQKEQECKQLKKRLEQREALTETYKVCYRAKHNDVKDRFIKYKQILDEIKQDISEYIKTPDFFEELDSNSAITRDEYIAICTRHNLASEINNIVKKCDKKE